MIIGADSEESAAGGTFPSPDDVHVFVKRNNAELQALLRSVLKIKGDSFLPQAYWSWFRDSRLPAVLLVRYWFTFAITAFVLLIVAMAITLMSRPGRFPIWAQLGMLAIQAAVFMTPVISGRRVRLHFAKYLAENSGMVCPDCGYILCGLPSKHQCPECGRAYTHSNIHRYWHRWMSNHMHLNLARDNGPSPPK